MKGYEIIEQRHLAPYKEDGIPPYDLKIGILDFLRELKSGPESIARNSSFMILGIDEVLYLAKKEEKRDIALGIRKILQFAADKLDRKTIEVQIVCKGKLIKGDSLWVDYRGENLPIDIIFGSPFKREIRGYPVFTNGFNLSS